MSDQSQGRRPARPACRTALLLVAAAVLALVAWLGVSFYRGLRVASALQDDLAQVELLASQPEESVDLRSAAALLHKTRLDVERARDVARPFLWAAPHMGWVPRFGPEIEAAPHLLTIAVDLTAAGDDLATALLPVLEDASGTGSSHTSMVPSVLAALSRSQGELLQAREAVRSAAISRAELENLDLGPRLGSWVSRLDRYLPLLDQAVEGAALIPELLGSKGRRTYLVLVQNEDELRATGGFISAVAVVEVEDGNIVDLRLEDSYAIDDFTNPYPAPPEPLYTYMLTELWLLRDSNWSPDFPTAAEAAIQLYGISREGRVDGVIAVDQEAIRRLVGSLAPLAVTGQDQPVTGDNVIRLARQAWAPGEGGADQEWWLQRKRFMGDVLVAARERLDHGLERPAVLGLVQSLRKTLVEKHALIYLTDGEAAAALARTGWDGSVRANAGDYLMVVDSNLGFNKANGLLEHEVVYSVNLEDLASPRAQLVLRHTSHAAPGDDCLHESRYDPTYAQMMQRCYWNYLRVLRPAGTRLVDATPHPVDGRHLISGQPSPALVIEETPVAGRSTFATFMLVPRGESVQTAFTFALPPTAVQTEAGAPTSYILTIQKQPGTRNVPVHVEVTLPAAAEVVRSRPEPTGRAGNVLSFDFGLSSDRTLTLAFQ